MTKARYGRNIGFEEGFAPYYVLEELVRAGFGEAACRYAVELAELDDFDEFADAMASLGVERCSGTGGAYATDAVPSEFANAALILRYPFLISYPLSESLSVLDEEPTKTGACKLEGDEVKRLRSEMFGGTHYDSIPGGWAARFGLEICEDIRTILESDADESDPHRSEAVGGYAIEQIKEKYGTLRWYDLISSDDEQIHESISNLNHVYEMLSGATCIECGATEEVLMGGGGWISVLCYRHLSPAWKEGNAVDVFARNHGFEKEWVGFDLSRMISRHLACSDANPVTVDPNSLTLTHCSGGDKEERYPYKELREAYPGLQCFRLIDTVYDVERMPVPSVEEIEAKIAEENAQP